MGLIDKVFGRLKVVGFINQNRWKCHCECGNETEVLGTNLKNGRTKSCGCLRKEISGKVLSDYNRSEKGRFNPRKEGRKHLLDWFNSYPQEHKKIARKIGIEYGKYALHDYIYSGFRTDKHKKACSEVLANFKKCRITKNQKSLSNALLEVGIFHRLEWFVPEIRRIIDIAIFDPKIAIEVDGESHTNPIKIYGISKKIKQEDDKLKDTQLQSLDWKVIRFTNEQVKNNICKCIEIIKSEVYRGNNR